MSVEQTTNGKRSQDGGGRLEGPLHLSAAEIRAALASPSSRAAPDPRNKGSFWLCPGLAALYAQGTQRQFPRSGDSRAGHPERDSRAGLAGDTSRDMDRDRVAAPVTPQPQCHPSSS